MKMAKECYPCLTRAALNTARRVTQDKALQKAVVKRVEEKMADLDGDWPPPLVARFIHETVEMLTHVPDPYETVKKECNSMALALYPWLVSLKETLGDAQRFDMGCRLAIAGNIIDFGVTAHLDQKKVMDTISHALETSVRGNISKFKAAVDRANHILWLGDNAGEIVFDKLLLEEMDCSKITYAVRGGAVLNDATREDALATGLSGMVKVIDSGAAIPGTLVEHCSEGFNQAFDRADLIISKGQGNFETLGHDDPRIFFLFKVKCPVVASIGRFNMGDVVIKRFRNCQG